MNIQLAERMNAMVPTARRMASGCPTSPVRLAAKQVSMAFLELMKVKEVATEKTCTGCKQTKPLSAFVVFRKTRKDGTQYDYPASKCKPCKAAVERKRAAELKAAPRPPKFKKAPILKCAKVAKTPKELALQIVEAATDARIQEIRHGERIVWQLAGKDMPDGAELLGTYDHGADWRDVLGDIS